MHELSTLTNPSSLGPVTIRFSENSFNGATQTSINAPQNNGESHGIQIQNNSIQISDSLL